MPQSLTQKNVNTFVKGLITEAGELTFPESASIDELNCDLRRDGSRRRRLGVKYEDNFTLSSFTTGTSTLINTGEWINVGGQSGLEFLVVQTGSVLRFYNKGSLPYSGNEDAQTVNLATYEVAGSVGSGNAKCQFASINGALVVASPAINTIYVERNNTTGVLTVTQISFRIRDFEWQGDKTTYSSSIASGSTSNARKYDTANSGWTGTKGAAALSTWIAARGTYPPLTLPWYAGKDTSGNFSVTEWENIFSGTSLTGNGTFILDFFSKNRSSVSGIAGLTTEIESSRFKAVSAFSGRVFYAGLDSSKNSGVILFSRLIEDLSELGDCYQINDPTSEDISDLLDTDGGTIRIPDAVDIKLLYTFGQSLYVFADNGVWSINGVDGVFRATEYSVKRVSNVGILNPQTFVAAEGIPFWWSRYGIHTLSIDTSTGQAQEQNLSISTIQTLWDNIDPDAKAATFAAYDAINKRIFWVYPSDGETIGNKYNKFLILDIPLQAFYPWTVSDEASNTDYIVGGAFYSGFGADEVVLDVVISNGDDVVEGTDDVISEQFVSTSSGTPAIVLLVRDNATGKLTMATFSSKTFLDWGTTNYSSYAEAGYEFFGDMLIQKTAPYVITYMRMAEEGWTGNETDGYDPIRGSSLLVSAYWNFKKTSAYTPQQAYRYKYPLVVNSLDLTDFDYPDTVITTRIKLTGRGRVMRLRFESEQGKDFILLGYGVLGGRNSRF